MDADRDAGAKGEDPLSVPDAPPGRPAAPPSSVGSTKWYLRLRSWASAWIQSPLVLAAICAVLFGQGFLALAVFVLAVSLLTLWRSRTRRRLAKRKQQVEALRKQVEAGAELLKMQTQQLAEAKAARDAAEDALRVARTYSRMEKDVANGLHYALWNGGAVKGGIKHFIEDNSLKLINDTFAAELATTSNGEKVRVETGIARRTGYGLKVTHASGPYTHELKDDGGCNTGDMDIQEVLARKAAAHFVRDGYYVVPLRDTHPLEYLFVLSNVLLGAAERESIHQQGPLIKITIAALRSTGEDDSDVL